MPFTIYSGQIDLYLNSINNINMKYLIAGHIKQESTPFSKTGLTYCRFGLSLCKAQFHAKLRTFSDNQITAAVKLYL